ncbi:SusD/RagB family nutrient-binding outer membrane lipoprotein [Polaribacter sp. MSW13]|uniref:SusD/RagB family nutrient-binding outer membrane lipoprotein n=1 Tax=Polaribacter marinus TaxID=2916838 RepID=A0A9X1VQQ1_9FLAO|nr:SusD/RagB family nutrient-binding outer membrane lipoprotein [Polaribacter marinus]MCI2229237.1 SusD/RagB family nutrient-binding outer membrane lipoprotein [Polaribacter marinus]
MRRIITKTIIALTLIVSVTACSDEYFNTNTPSGTADVSELRMNDLLAPVIHSTMEGQRSAELAFGNYTQYFVGQGGVASGETTASGLWSQVYLYILPNIKVIKEKAAEKGATHYAAVADILTAINLGIATDTWNNIPYSEATLGQNNLFPKFDTQDQIYTSIFTLLDSAISALSSPDNSGIFIGREDLIYNGDTDKWLRAAYTLKARYQLRLLNKGTVTANDVLTTIANGFTSISDDFEMYYDDKNINPWYSVEVLSKATGNYHNDIASQLISTMNGDNYPFQSGLLTVDPRLSEFATNDGAADWKGYVSGGGGLSPDGVTNGNTGFVADGYYTSIDSPLMLISYAEAMFIKAEAAFLANGGDETSVGSTATAYTAYMNGIAASMNRYSVNGADYMADGAVAVGAGGLMLNHIMKEKYIHNFLNPETFVDFRRYNFSDDVFKGLKIREEIDTTGDYFGQWFRRATYPSTELNRNRENVEANQQTPVTKVWWEQ